METMENPSDERPTISGPKNKSLQAYKIWIQELVNRFTSDKTNIILTEEEWVRYWQEYWKEQNRKR
jgi:hypothetical protein